jgi:hypothetical protein
MPAPTRTLENLWDLEMRVLYDEAVKYCHYRATYFLQMVVDHGGLEATRILLHKEGISEGLATLWQYGMLDLTMEARMFQRDETGARKWDPLFTSEEFAIARARLVQLEYAPALDGSL